MPDTEQTQTKFELIRKYTGIFLKYEMILSGLTSRCAMSLCDLTPNGTSQSSIKIMAGSRGATIK